MTIAIVIVGLIIALGGVMIKLAQRDSERDDW